MLQGTSLINIKMAKAHRTFCFGASCMMARFALIGIVIEEKARLHDIKHNAERYEYECDIPLPVKERPHPAWRLNVMKIRDCTEIYTDGSKIGDKVRTGAAIHVDRVLKRLCK
jgi:hypothetical protein